MMTHRDPNLRLSRFVAALLLLTAGAFAQTAPSDTASDAATRSEAPRLAARGAFDAPRARVGDTIEYRLRLAWRDAQSLVRVLPPRDELRTPGLEILGQATLHRKTAGPDGILGVTEFRYRMVATAPGRGRVEPFAVRYLDGVSGREQTVEVAGSVLDILAARAPLHRRPVFWIALAAVALAAAVFLAWIVRRKRAAVPPPPRESPAARELRLLRERAATADSRAWLSDAERLCLDFLARDLGLAHTAQVRFEAALEQYLARHPGLEPAEVAGWTTLRDLFHEARFSGARKEPHELRDACRRLKTCLKLPGEDS